MNDASNNHRSISVTCFISNKHGANQRFLQIIRFVLYDNMLILRQWQMNTVGLDYTSATKVIDLEMFGPSIVKGINENPHFTSNKFYITYCTVKFSVRTCPRKMKKGFFVTFSWGKIWQSEYILWICIWKNQNMLNLLKLNFVLIYFTISFIVPIIHRLQI